MSVSFVSPSSVSTATHFASLTRRFSPSSSALLLCSSTSSRMPESAPSHSLSWLRERSRSDSSSSYFSVGRYVPVLSRCDCSMRRSSSISWEYSFSTVRLDVRLLMTGVFFTPLAVSA